VTVFAENVKELYEKNVADYFTRVALTCAQNKIKYIPVAVEEGFEKVLTAYLVENKVLDSLTNKYSFFIKKHLVN